MRERVVLGLSGGVDSAVAARFLQKDYDVFCVWLDIGPCGGVPASGGEDAAAVAANLGLPFQAVDIRQALETEVCAPFVADYLSGRTPLPCARCNPAVKFPALLAAADRLDARYVATGHYARRATGPDGRALLLRGLPANDQSYMLSRLPQAQLQRIIFPLGDYEKRRIRVLAGAADLPVAHKPDSMEICFIPDGDYAAWLDRRGNMPPPGDFVDTQGNVLGQHKGIHHYTIGQRRGLGISSSARLFVSALDPIHNVVVLSDGTDLFVQSALCQDLNWISIPALSAPLDVTVRLRHSKTETPAIIRPTGDNVTIDMKSPARAPTPGQLAAFYQGDTVVGAGWIVSRP